MKNKFTSKFFEGNRTHLADILPGSLILISANSVLQMSADTNYPFRQDSNFWYLTGLNNPDLCLLINTLSGQVVLLLPDQNDYQKEWDGENDKISFHNISGINEFESISNIEKLIKTAKKNGLNICYLKPAPEIVEPYGFYSNPARKKLSEKIIKIEPNPVDIRLDIARLRQVKQPVELKAIKRAINITARSMEEVKKNIDSFNNENEIVNSLTSLFYRFGSNGHGYEPIVASGNNASIIHYRGNDQNLINDQLLLLDVGAQAGYYSADISRTWVVGEPSSRQIEIHQAVLQLQKEAYKLLKPGVYLKDYQLKMEKLTRSKMKKLKCSNADKKYPHGFSHYLGLDVHDAGDYNMPLSEGMVITVEPGIYLPDEGIGVRIEDDVLITSEGIEILSKEIPNNL